ncbi:hypothetical protein EO98_13050 [Methanosarcina sp. 2.H.T.1A.6]|nr:hypothetical protein EO94_14650 [Methanosarcina sp. 2.H.T.1A.3]KKG18585.1 hypothetical protein EO97_04060 [Methanosarcina sp. 2.H.T.1A.15]KKG24335.1 hypothetical protein EO98_13050 [Methanosarcina sp. 2.H.T.1A.6]KKG25697.1 hypothetical protein EO96_15465 [Methanosarcina sp. 2.H.T.1A.8]
MIGNPVSLERNLKRSDINFTYYKMDIKIYTDAEIKKFFTIRSSIKKRIDLFWEHTQKNTKLDMNRKIPQQDHKEEIHFYNNIQEKGKIFYTKKYLSRSS